MRRLLFWLFVAAALAPACRGATPGGGVVTGTPVAAVTHTPIPVEWTACTKDSDCTSVERGPCTCGDEPINVQHAIPADPNEVHCTMICPPERVSCDAGHCAIHDVGAPLAPPPPAQR